MYELLDFSPSTAIFAKAKFGKSKFFEVGVQGPKMARRSLNWAKIAFFLRKKSSSNWPKMPK